MLGGDDAFLFPLVLMGATGAIAASSHLCTRRFVEMIECGRRGAVARRAAGTPRRCSRWCRPSSPSRARP